MAEYTSEFTGEQIDALLEKVDQRVSTPAPAEDKLITSGGVYTATENKVDKVTGKGLSTNDYTNEDKTKLGALPTKADLDTALAAKEDKANKVTSFSNPTDTQYPSAKLTKDSLDAKADKDTDAVEGNLAKVDANGNPVDSGIASDEIGEIEEAISVLRTKAGIAEGIADTISAGTAQEFLQRQSGGDGVNCIKRIKGKTIAWNQLANFDNLDYESVGLHIVSTNGRIVISGTATASVGYALMPRITTIAGHKYLVHLLGTHNFASMSWRTLDMTLLHSAIFTETVNTNNVSPTIRTVEGVSYNADLYYYLVDLTLMFGAGNEPSTVAEFEALYPLPYYPYNPGVLKSNDAAALLTDGRNQWDEEWRNDGWWNNSGEWVASSNYISSKNKIKVFAGQTYHYKFPRNGYIRYYDANGNYISSYATPRIEDDFIIPNGVSLIAFSLYYSEGATTYNHDICINLSDPSFNGTYEPYWQRVLALRLSELTGIPEGGTEADRVTMFPNGLGRAGSAFDSIFVENGVTKARRAMARVDLGILNWTLNETYGFVASPTPSPKAAFSAICEKYPFVGIYTNVVDKTCGYIFNTGLLVKDSAYSDAATFKAAMDGVYLEFELATPIVYTDLQYADGTPFTMPATILVDIGGVERVISPTHADGSPSAPFRCDSTYSISIKRLVDIINSLD